MDVDVFEDICLGYRVWYVYLELLNGKFEIDLFFSNNEFLVI